MKTAILCLVFLIVGALAGSALSGYLVDRFHKRYYAMLLAGDLGRAAMEAELIKGGDVAIVLDTLERYLPVQVKMVHENDLMRESIVTDSSLMATKRFYVCTRSPIPAEIDEILKPVPLADDACGVQP